VVTPVPLLVPLLVAVPPLVAPVLAVPLLAPAVPALPPLLAPLPSGDRYCGWSIVEEPHAATPAAAMDAPTKAKTRSFLMVSQQITPGPSPPHVLGEG
jgi:hypothetical protein